MNPTKCFKFIVTKHLFIQIPTYERKMRNLRVFVEVHLQEIFRIMKIFDTKQFYLISYKYEYILCESYLDKENKN